MIISSPTDFRAVAQARLPRFLFDYLDGGANQEYTLGRNRSDLAGVALRQRVLKDVSDAKLDTTLFGQKMNLPVVLSPVGMAGMYRRRGEVQAARAAHKKGIPFTLSTVGLCSLKEVIRDGGAPIWFQLYVLRDRAFMKDLLQTAKALGVTTLVFTVDMPVPGSRYRDAHAGLSGPYAPFRRMVQAMLHPGWAFDVGLLGRPHFLGNVAPVLGKDSGLEDYMGWLARNFDPSIKWKDLEWIREIWDGPLIIKGVLDPEDAKEAVHLGAQGIVVSNHGGRQLDGALSTTRALPPIADMVGDKLTVLADGGIRSGLDVVRMMALGAKGVLLGRAWVYALASAGEAGVTQLLDLIEKEMRVAMALTGVRDVADINRSLLAD